MSALIAVPRASPKGKRKESGIREKEREGSTKGKGGLYRKIHIPNLPPKWPMSGITFHYDGTAQHLG